MRSDEVARVLAAVPGVEVATGPDGVTAHLPALGDTVRLDPAGVLRAEPVAAPTGLPAVLLGLRRGHGQLTLIVTVDDVVFAPADPADMLAPGAPLRVPDAPDLIAYSEMHRDVRALGRAVDLLGAEFDAETLAATLLAQRCFLAGAIAVGLWPVRVAAWWEYAWARAGAAAPLAPFRPDPDWDRLLVDVAAARHVTN